MERTTAAELLATLADGVADLTSSTAWRAWLDVQRRFHRYSWGNTLLIAAQCPDATRVAGFHAWLRLGRHVRKGEHGIAILAPVVPRLRVVDADSGDERWVAGRPHAFRVAHVFDVSQTDGEELAPPPVTRLEGGDPKDWYTQLRDVAHSLEFTVEEDYLPDDVNGDCNHALRQIRIEVRNGQRQQVKTLAHELGHAILHADRAGLCREQAELEAESVAYVVCAGLGIDTSEYSFGYLAVWAGGGEQARRAIAESAQRIQTAAHRVLDAVTPGAEAVAA
ncbi:MAG: ArdC-like ssDNA-binding domain-containing protein [Candidatus Dormibacteria bacterium]|jgi:antirestriction protein ArdC